MVLHRDGDAFDGLLGVGIFHHAVDTVQGLLHKGQHAVVVIVPEVGQLRGTGGLRRGTFQGQLAALAVVVHIVLTAAVDGVPGIAVGDAAAVGVGHI